MDFKGVTWAGDIYEKFEAMCLEVEEVMYEDTVKYVENQAQKVGVSVKKFYADVMQDLLPPSCVGPVKVAAAAELPLESCTTPTDIDEKPKPTISDNHRELNIKRAGDEDICNSTAQESTLSVCSDANRLPHTSPTQCLRKSKRSGITRRSIGIKRISHPPEVDRTMSPSCDTRSACPMANDDLNVTTTSSEFFSRDDPNEAVAKNRPISDVAAEPCSSDQILSAESVQQEKMAKELSVEPLRQNDEATDCNSSSDDSPPAPIDTLRRDGSPSQMSSFTTETREVGIVGEEATASCEDNFDIEVIEPDNIIKPIEKSKLEESCILVEGNELHLVPQRAKKHKSYKKKIYDVLSSKLRSTKKQDVCVSEHEDLSDKNDTAGEMSSALAVDSDRRKLPAHCSCDFGWELL